MIRAVSLDVGGTLLQAHPSVGHVYARVGREFGLNAAPEPIDRAFRAAWKRRDRPARARIAGRIWWRRIVDDVLAQLGFEGDGDRCFDALYQAFADGGAWRVHDDVEPALGALRVAGVRLGVLSNWDERLPALLHDLGLGRYLEWTIVSSLESLQKPDPAIFRRVCQVSGLPAASILHVGDDPEEDVAAARRAGMAALRIDRRLCSSRAGVLNDLRQLPAHLDERSRRARRE